MTWFKIDDGWARHPKVRKAGRDGRALWVTTGTECAAARTDGIVDPDLLKDYAYLADVTPTKARKVAQDLIAAGLWHDATGVRSCPACKDVIGTIPDGAYYFHDWAVYQPEKADLENPVEKDRWKRRKALSRDDTLRSLICQRDRNQCRYCGVRVNWRARRGAESGTYDHVDPDGENTLENVVVACRQCNGRKGERTPDEAGMPLLPVPGAYVPDLAVSGPDLAGDKPGPETGQEPADPGSAGHRPSRAPRTRGGTGQNRAEPELGRDLAGSGRNDTGDGPEGAGPGGAGPRPGQPATDENPPDHLDPPPDGTEP